LWVFNPRQLRDSDGRWTAGGAARRVRTGRADSLRERGTSSPRTQHAKTTATAKRINAIHAGQLTPSRQDRDALEFQHPRLRREAVAKTGSPLRPRQESLRVARSRTSAHRDVAVNRLTGKFVAVPGESRDLETARGVLRSRRMKARASAQVKKQAAPRPRLPKTEYIGRRRAEP
jgi:hypothetical protein